LLSFHITIKILMLTAGTFKNFSTYFVDTSEIS